MNKAFKVLIVDDEPSLHEDYEKVLTSKYSSSKKLEDLKNEFMDIKTDDKPTIQIPKFELVHAYQGEEAYALIANAIDDEDKYSLAFIDMRMPPGWDGLTTIEKIWEIDPDIQMVICTAYSDFTLKEIQTKLGINDRYLILKKPFDKAEVLQMAISLIKKWQLTKDLNNHLKQLESQVSKRTAEIQATIESTADGILAISSDKIITNYNKQFIEIWDIDPRMYLKNSLELRKYILNELISDADTATFFQSIEENPYLVTQREIKTKKGLYLDVVSRPQIDFTGKVIGRVWSFRNISKRKILEYQLTHQATHDELTDLPNRKLLIEKFSEIVTNNADRQFACLFVDLDRFKLINDAFGHDVGNLILKQIAEKLQLCFDKEAIVSRVGGDEFFVIIKTFDDNADLINLSKSCIDEIEKPFSFLGKELRVSASIGISIYPNHGQEFETLFKKADQAMYSSKEAGRAQVTFYDAGIKVDDSSAKLDIEINLRKAIERNEFVLYYQPLINLETQEVFGFEALIRWIHPKLGMIPPLDFVTVAEEIGLIVPISEWVLNEACKQLVEWNREYPHLKMAINISPQVLKQYIFIDMINSVINTTKVNTQNLEFEITESVMMHSNKIIKNNLDEAKGYNIALVIDDFGTGYSNLGYLHHFPLSKVKIDKSFIKNLNENETEKSLILAIINIAKSLNLQVLAEGIETKEQLNYLMNNHCLQGQGYYFSKALCKEDAYHYLVNAINKKN